MPYILKSGDLYFTGDGFSASQRSAKRFDVAGPVPDVSWLFSCPIRPVRLRVRTASIADASTSQTCQLPADSQ